MSQSTPTSRPTVSPSAIGQFYKLQQCPMYLYHRYIDEDFAGIADVSLSPLLAATGEAFETSQLQHLLGARVHSIGPESSDVGFDECWVEDCEANRERMRTLVNELATGTRTKPIVFYQPSVQGTIGSWPIRGDTDIVIAKANGGSSQSSTVEIRVMELKSSSAVKTHHQLQAAIYSLLFETLFDGIDTRVTGSVISQDPDDNDLGALLTPTGDVDLRRLGTFNLQTRQNDVQLLLEEGGTLDEVLLQEGTVLEEGNPGSRRCPPRNPAVIRGCSSGPYRAPTRWGRRLLAERHRTCSNSSV